MLNKFLLLGFLFESRINMGILIYSFYPSTELLSISFRDVFKLFLNNIATGDGQTERLCSNWMIPSVGIQVYMFLILMGCCYYWQVMWQKNVNKCCQLSQT